MTFLLLQKFIVHILLDHLEDYFDLSNVTLIKTTDELGKNIYHYFNRRLMKSVYYLKEIANPNHGKRLLRAIRHLNTYNL